MRGIVLIVSLMMLIHTTSLAETATTGNLLPNAGTGQTNVQNSNSTIDGINSSTGFTLNGVTDFSSNYNELEAQGTGTVYATGTLEGLDATKPDGSSFTTTTDSLDGGVRLESKTEVQNCEWAGSAYQCGQATSGQDSYSTTVNILDEDENVLATVTQNRNNDSGYYGNTFTYTDTVIHTGEGARKWEWEWTGIDGNDSNSTSPVGPNLLGAELKATLLDILYFPVPTTVATEINETFEDIKDEFKEIEKAFEELFFEEEIKMEEEFKEPIMNTMKEEDKIKEPMFEEFAIIEEEEKEEEPIMNTVQMFEEEKEKPNEEKSVSELLEEGFKEEQKQNEEEPESEVTESTESEKEESTEEVKQKETKTAKLETVLEKIDQQIKDIDKNLQLKNLVKLKVMSGDNILEVYNVPFYEPKDIYLDQLDITDNRVIYTQDLTQYKQNDPIFIQKQQLNRVLQEQQNLIKELEILKNG